MDCESARRRYLPEQIKVLFVAEAPPANLQRFFYFENVKHHDWLFLALMRFLYADASDAAAKELRSRKQELLHRFRTDGYYLVDAREKPMLKGTSTAMKRRLIRDSLDRLITRLRKLGVDEIPIVLISSPVYAVCSRPLKDAGLNVINTEMIDFPCCGRQTLFRQKLGSLLCQN